MSEKGLSFAYAIIPQADHDFETFCFGGRKYGTSYTAGRILDRSIDLRICPDDGEILGVGIKLL